MSFLCRILRGAKQRPCRPVLTGAYDGADFRKARSKLTRCVLVSGLALSVIASRCHLSQSERPWQSAKFPVYTLRPAAARGAEGAALRLSAFAKGSHFGGAGAKRLRGRGCWQEAAHLVWHCLAEAQPHRKHDLNLGSAPPLPALPSPSSLRDATSPKVRGLGSPPSFQFGIFTPCCRKGAEGVTRRLHAFAKGSPFGGAGKAVRL